MRKGLSIRICLAVLGMFMLSIFVRIGTRQILVKRLGVENTFTRLVFWDNEALETDISIDWAAQYPFEEREDADGEESVSTDSMTDADMDTSVGAQLRKKVLSAEQKVDFYATDLLTGYQSFVDARYRVDDFIGWKQNSSTEDVIEMENGYLTGPSAKVEEQDIKKIADSLSDFGNYLSEQGIPLYYVNCGSKVNPADKELTEEDAAREYSNENADALLQALRGKKVHTIDMRQYMLVDGKWYDRYYITDPHWTTETGLWCAGIIADELNRSADFAFDKAYFNIDSYEVTTYPNFWLGSYGRKLRLGEESLESYSCILPKFETDFTIDVPTRNIHKEGAYAESLYNMELLEQIKEYEDTDWFWKPTAYETTTWENDALGIIKNRLDNENSDKKILIIQDSFGWYTATYLACDAGEVHMIHLTNFNGSIRSYVNEIEPDAVIVLYNSKNITLDKETWETHKSLWDFR